MSEPSRISIQYPHGVTDGDTLVTRVGANLYRLELDSIPELIAKTEDEIPHLPRFGDTIEARTLEPGKIEYVAVAERANLRRYDWFVSGKVADSLGLKAIFAKVEAAGGHWEQALRGIVKVALPADSSYDPSEEMDSLLRDA